MAALGLLGSANQILRMHLGDSQAEHLNVVLVRCDPGKLVGFILSGISCQSMRPEANPRCPLRYVPLPLRSEPQMTFCFKTERLNIA